MIKELDMVMLTRDVQEPQLPKGSKGAVVHCYSDGQGFEVEFVQETGETIAVLTLERSDIQPEREMIQAQVLAILNVLPEELLAKVRDFAELLTTREEPNMFLNETQIKILQAIKDGASSSHHVAERLGLGIDLIKYHIQAMRQDGYLSWKDVSGTDGYYDWIELTPKGRIAIEHPDLLLSQHQESNIPTHQTTINAPNSQFGFVNSGSGSVSDFAQNIGQNLNDITKLIDSLREAAQTFPPEQREEVLGYLDDLQEDLSKPERQEPSRIKRRLKDLVAIALTLGTMAAGTVDFTNNLTDLSEKLGVPIELSQSQTSQQLPSADGR